MAVLFIKINHFHAFFDIIYAIKLKKFQVNLLSRLNFSMQMSTENYAINKNGTIHASTTH